jgi:hypothetical protein
MNSGLQCRGIAEQLSRSRKGEARMRNDQQDLGRNSRCFGEVADNNRRRSRLQRSRQAFVVFREYNISGRGCRHAGDSAYLDASIAHQARSDRLGNLADPPFHCTCFIRLRPERKAAE